MTSTLAASNPTARSCSFRPKSSLCARPPVMILTIRSASRYTIKWRWRTEFAGVENIRCMNFSLVANLEKNDGDDGTRTRGLCRDRVAVC